MSKVERTLEHQETSLPQVRDQEQFKSGEIRCEMEKSAVIVTQVVGHASHLALTF